MRFLFLAIDLDRVDSKTDYSILNRMNLGRLVFQFLPSQTNFQLSQQLINECMCTLTAQQLNSKSARVGAVANG